MSDLHLESQEFRWKVPQGDVLILAGDLCHACRLDPALTKPHAVHQRDRVMRFIETAFTSFAHVLLIAGNHDHYDGVFEDTVPALRSHLPGVTVLDDDDVTIGGIRFFGTTLWSDFEGGSEASMEKARRGAGEFFFVKMRSRDNEGNESLTRFRPERALQAHEKALRALKDSVSAPNAGRTVVISHHAPSRKGLNPLHMGNGLDGAYASDLDEFIASLGNVPVWVHGHTHIRRTYRIGNTIVRANCRGFGGRDRSAQIFSTGESFEIQCRALRSDGLATGK